MWHLEIAQIKHKQIKINIKNGIFQVDTLCRILFNKQHKKYALNEQTEKTGKFGKPQVLYGKQERYTSFNRMCSKIYNGRSDEIAVVETLT